MFLLPLAGDEMRAVWFGMIARCHNPRLAIYPAYGGRGIYVCDEWRASFERFLSDVGPRPSPRHSLDRRDNDGPYCRDNCRWATSKEQTRNTRQNRWITVGSETLIFHDWCKRNAVPPWVAYQRIRQGWSPADAVSTPHVSRFPNRWRITGRRAG